MDKEDLFKRKNIYRGHRDVTPGGIKYELNGGVLAERYHKIFGFKPDEKYRQELSITIEHTKKHFSVSARNEQCIRRFDLVLSDHFVLERLTQPDLIMQGDQVRDRITKLNRELGPATTIFAQTWPISRPGQIAKEFTTIAYPAIEKVDTISIISIPALFGSTTIADFKIESDRSWRAKIYKPSMVN